MTTDLMRRRDNRAPGSTRPVVDSLETRRLFAVTISQSTDFDGNELLRIVSDNAADDITITEIPSDFDYDSNSAFDGGTIVEVAGGPTFIGGEFAVFEVILSGGDDTLTWIVEESYEFYYRSYQVDLGLGNDTFSFTQFADEDVADESFIGMEVDSDAGNDHINVRFDDILYGSVVAVDVDAEEDNDYVAIDAEDVAVFGTFSANLDLGSGNNTAVVRVAGAFAGSSIDVNVAGGNSATGRDLVTVAIADGVENGTLSVTAGLNAGNDQMTVNLGKSFDIETFDEGEFLPRGTAQFQLDGGDGNDVMTVRRSPYIVVPGQRDPLLVELGGLLDIHLIGQTGNDTLTVDLDPGDGVELDGRLRVKVDGLGGNDTLRGEFLFTDESGLVEEYEPGFFNVYAGIADIAFRGGHANDQTTLRLIDRSESIEGEPLLVFQGGTAIVDGGANLDRCDLITNLLSRIRSLGNESGSVEIVP